MKKETYDKIQSRITSNKPLYKTVLILYKGLPLIVAAVYAAFLVYLIIARDIRVIRFVIVPAGTFLAVTVMRTLINEPRPYEKENIKPLFKKDTKGKSFPSRHTASAFIISFAVLYIDIRCGIIALILSAVIAFLRPIAGVHYIRDVAAGALISALFGVIFFFVI